MSAQMLQHDDALFTRRGREPRIKRHVAKGTKPLFELMAKDDIVDGYSSKWLAYLGWFLGGCALTLLILGY